MNLAPIASEQQGFGRISPGSLSGFEIAHKKNDSSRLEALSLPLCFPRGPS
jgi:hypothetical protein